MLVAVFGDAHAHAEALEAVLAAAERAGADELWSLGDMIGGGPDPEHVVARTREMCRVALLGNHDYVATGAVDAKRLGPAVRSLELARERLDEDAVAWMRTRRPAARRHDVQCWHGSPRSPVWEFVGPRNAAACLERQRADLGLVAHTHLAAAFGPRTAAIQPGVPLDVSDGKWLLNPGAVGALPPPRRGWFSTRDVEHAWWLALDLDARTATWQLAPYDPRPARARAGALGLE